MEKQDEGHYEDPPRAEPEQEDEGGPPAHPTEEEAPADIDTATEQ